MCRIDDGEFCEVENKGQKTARKAHRCDECGRIINKGEIYELTKALMDRKWTTYKTCSHCEIGKTWLMNECGGYIFTEVVEEIQEHAEEYPKMYFALTKFVVGARRQWQRFDGQGLLPAMVLPEGKYT